MTGLGGGTFWGAEGLKELAFPLIALWSVLLSLTPEDLRSDADSAIG
jgi:hypothetical protein